MELKLECKTIFNDFTHSCGYCQKIIVDTSRVPLKIKGWKPSIRLIPLDFTVKDVIQAAGDGCIFCALMANDHVRDLGDHNLGHLPLFMEFEETEYGITLIWALGVYSEDEGGEQKFARSAITLENFHVHVESDDPSSLYVLNRPIELSPKSTRSFDLMRGWLHECLTTHEHHDQVQYSPSRLVEIVGHTPEILLRLRDNMQNERKAYIALSYCWGGPQRLTTTKATLAAWKNNIPANLLPQTIIDAVNVAGELGVSYLFVDSLCIVQDDESDKAVEIAQMPRIYNSAVVTVSATRAEGVWAGFLFDRGGEKKIRNPSFKLPYRCPTGILGSITLVPFWGTWLRAAEPLDDRAWALQERLLASRIIDFGEYQTRWHCPHVRDSERYTDGERPFLNFKQRAQKGSLIDRQTLIDFITRIEKWHSDHTEDSDDVGYSNPWHRLVEMYSLRHLTFPEDRILAISGLAEEYATYYRSDYLAGAWRTTILLDIMWSRPDGVPHRNEGSRLQMPSWSWAAVTGVAQFGINTVVDQLSMRELVLSFVDCQVILVNERAPFGAVKSGRLVVRGKSRSASLTQWSCDPDREGFHETTFYDTDKQVELALRSVLDCPGPDLENEPQHLVRLLKVFHRVRDDFTVIGGLILQQNASQADFKRVGAFASRVVKHDADETDAAQDITQWFDDCEEEEIIIV